MNLRKTQTEEHVGRCWIHVQGDLIRAARFREIEPSVIIEQTGRVGLESPAGVVCGPGKLERVAGKIGVHVRGI